MSYYSVAVAIVTIIAIATELVGFIYYLATGEDNKAVMNAGTLLLFLSAILNAVLLIMEATLK